MHLRIPMAGRRRPVLGGIAITAVTVALLAQPALAPMADAAPQTQHGSPPIAANAPWTRTVNWLIAQTTPAERVGLIAGSWANKIAVDYSKDPDSHNQAGYVRGVKRLGIPEVRHTDAQGIETFADATAFPNRLGIASSFDRKSIRQFGRTVGREGLDADTDLLYGPQVDTARTPSWRRNMTTYGEDAYLASQLTATEINAIQGTGLMAQVKHIGMYNGQNQDTASLVDEQAARELYLAAGEAAVKDAGVTSLMCSYATFQIVGYQDDPAYACQNSGLLKGIVKGEWGFKGFVTSDYGAVKSTSSLLAGIDQEFLTFQLQDEQLLPLVDPASNTYDRRYAAAAKESAARILYQYERFGLLDNDYIPSRYRSRTPQHGDVDTTDNTVAIDKQAGIKTALRLAERAGVLLKNDSALPLKKSASVAVMGQSSTLLPAAAGGERSTGFGDRVTIDPYQAMTKIAGAKVSSTPGVDILGRAIPATALTQDEAGTRPGLVRTQTLDGHTTSSTDRVLDGNQTNLVKGATYSWTGYVDVPRNDTYRLMIQRPAGIDTGDPAKYNEGIRTEPFTTAATFPGWPSVPPVTTTTLSVDGTVQTMTDPDTKVLNNAYPSFSTNPTIKTTARNGQYLGYVNTATSVDLAPGRHKLTVTYTPRKNLAVSPTLRLAWSAKNKALEQAEAAAAANDVTVVFADDHAMTLTDGESTEVAVGKLAAEQDQLIEKVAAAAHKAGNQVVVVLNTGSAVQMPWIENVDSVLEMWYPGQEGGTASANLLYGRTNPSGKLTLSFPVNSAQTLFAGHPERAIGTQEGGEPTKTIKWTENLNMGYRWFTDPRANTKNYQPLFAFGHGLSYTNFKYSRLRSEPTRDGGANITFSIRNTGKVTGSESAQVYVEPSAALPARIQQTKLRLVQFGRVTLRPGQSEVIKLHIEARDLSSWDSERNRWALGTGRRAVHVGAASDDLRLTSSVKIGRRS